MKANNTFTAAGRSNAQESTQTFTAILLPDDTHSSSLDLWSILRFVRKRWLFLSLCALLGGVVAVGGSFFLPRIYRAEVLVAPSAASESGNGIDKIIGRYGALASAAGLGVSGDSSSTRIAIARLQSRGFIESFIKDQALLPILYPGKFPAVPAKEGLRSGSVPTLQDAYRKFVGNIMLVKHDKTTDLVTIRVDWTDRLLAATWANLLVARLNAAMRSDAIQETEKSINYLTTESQKAGYVSLKDSISSLLESQINKRMLAVTQPDYSFRVIDPAKPSDENKKTSPKRVIFLIFGMAIGFFVGSILAICKQSKLDLATPENAVQQSGQ